MIFRILLYCLKLSISWCFVFGTVVNSINNRSFPISWPEVWCGDGFHTSDYSGDMWRISYILRKYKISIISCTASITTDILARASVEVDYPYHKAHIEVYEKICKIYLDNIISSKLTKVFDWIKIFDLKPSSYVQVLDTLYYLVTED